MKLISCTYQEHAPAILEILNDAILNTTAIYDYVPRPLESMVGWFKGKEAGGFPVIGAVDNHGTLLGFASYGSFRAWPAYKYSVEHSIYVGRVHRRKGLGGLFLQALIDDARSKGFHNLVAGIDAENTPSIALHRRYGFEHSGTIKHAGFKFGQWLDLAFYQRILNTPLSPVDG